MERNGYILRVLRAPDEHRKVLYRECYPHHEVLASTSGSTGSSAATVICSEGLLQSDASYITVIADSTAK